MNDMKAFADWLRGPFMKHGSAASVQEGKDAFRLAGEKAREYALLADDKVRFANARAAAVEVEAAKLATDMTVYYTTIIKQYQERGLLLEEENVQFKRSMARLKRSMVRPSVTAS